MWVCGSRVKVGQEGEGVVWVTSGVVVVVVWVVWVTVRGCVKR